MPRKILVGLRTWKTVIAVALTAGLMKYVYHETPFFACIGAVVGVGRTPEGSVEDAFIRNLGTAMGGIIGILMLLFTDNVFLEALGIIPIILIIAALGKQASIVPACIVYFAVVYLNEPGQNAFIYALRRMVDTYLGSIIGLGVNLLFKAPRSESDEQGSCLKENGESGK